MKSAANKELILPENARKLHTNAVKVFINEIYLKQQLLGFWFKTMRNRQLAESPVPLIHDLDKLFKRKAKQIEKLDEMRLERNRLLYAAYDKLIKLPDEVKTQVVHMEFDTQIIHRSNSRSYAYPNGENGISELPIIFRLPENLSDTESKRSLHCRVCRPSDARGFQSPQRQPEKTKTVWRFHQTVFSRAIYSNFIEACHFQAAHLSPILHQK